MTAQQTALTALHTENGATLTEFAGYDMPVKYPLGTLKEHLHTREKAGLFDVSHMGQVVIKGSEAASELEKLIPIDIAGMPINTQRYGFFTNDNGGIEDDLMVSRWGQTHYMVVLNAACKDTDIAHLKANLSGDVELTELNDRALIALQGPQAKHVLARLGLELADMAFMDAREMSIGGFNCLVTRSGYTGEDGFEISVKNSEADALGRLLQADEASEWIGLGARDSLRLEGGMCLYGHDINSQTSPVEGSITWAIQAVRRTGGEREGGFPGADVILPQIPANITRKRVGLKPDGKAPLREGVELFNDSGERIGEITSGGFSPSLNQPIAMGYVEKAYAKIGTELVAKIRAREVKITVSNPTFVPNNFYRI